MENNRKQEILSSAKKLFYEKGYVGTNLKDIALELGITKQAISHYYRKKEMLAAEVYEGISIDFLGVFIEKGRSLGYDEVTSEAASCIWIDRYYTSDECARRFFNEYVYHGLGDYFNFEFEASRHFAGGRMFLGEMSREMFYAVYIASRYAAKGLLYHYVNGDISLKRDEFERYYLKLCFEPFGHDEKTIDRLFEDGTRLLSQTQITVAPYFSVS